MRAAGDDFDTGQALYGFFAMVDLRGSYAYRLQAGERAAYLRSETFVRLLRRLLSAYKHVSVMKELGDALLINSSDIKPLVESLSALDTIANLWDYGGEGDNKHPRLDYRAAIVFGRATRVARSGGTDFLGAVVDRLARLSSVRSGPDDALVIVDQEAWSKLGDCELDEQLYSWTALATATTGSKAGEPALRYSFISIDRPAFRQSQGSFRPLRLLIE